MADFTIKQYDRLPAIETVLNDERNRAIDLTGAVVTMRMRPRRTSSVDPPTADIVTLPVIVSGDPALGEVEVPWPEDSTDTAGFYYAEFKIDYGGGLIMSVPNTGDFTIEIVADLATQEISELLISIQEMKDLYLFGVNLTDDNGQPYPDAIFEHNIKAAIEWTEKELDIFLTARDVVDEVHDHYAIDYARWGYFRLDHYPIIEKPSRIAFKYPSMDNEVVINQDWIILEDGGRTGVIQIVPGQGNLADVLLIPGALMPMWSGATGRVPGIWHFDYRAGFELGTLPEDIKQVVCMQAAIRILDIAGDLIAGAGIANFSISVPGLSQSVGTTSSATNAGYGARIIQYRRQINDALPNLKRFYGKGSRLVVV